MILMTAMAIAVMVTIHNCGSIMHLILSGYLSCCLAVSEKPDFRFAVTKLKQSHPSDKHFYDKKADCLIIRHQIVYFFYTFGHQLHFQPRKTKNRRLPTPGSRLLVTKVTRKKIRIKFDKFA